MSIISRAYLFARNAHNGQVRKYTGEPYIQHCRNVAKLVSGLGGSEQMIAAAYLHDTIEDCGVNVNDIRDEFGSVVLQLVIGLTDMYTKENYPDMNRELRKKNEAARYATESIEVQTIKLCDLIDNTSCIVKYDPEFAITYLREKADLLEVFDVSVLRLAKRLRRN